MKRLFLALVSIGVVFFSNHVVASDEISISTPRHMIFLHRGSIAHVPLVLRVQNHRDNRKIRLDWEMGASEKQLNNPTAQEMKNGTKEYELPRKEDEYLLFTDEDFQRRISQSKPDGLYLSVGEYEIRATLTRMVDGKAKEFTATVKVTIGVPDKESK